MRVVAAGWLLAAFLAAVRGKEQDTGISKTTIERIVTEDLKLKKTPAKCIPRFLTNEQKLCRLATCEDMLEMTRTDPEWKDKLITGDETWVYGYDPETKCQLPSGEVREGREETADNERSGSPSTSTTPEKVDKVLELVRKDRRITVREVVEEAGISFGSTQSIMKDILGVRRFNAVVVPKDLTFDQKNARKETASLNLEATTDDPELPKRPRPKKARKAPSKVKIMLTVFFDYQGIVHHEFQQHGSTITADSYLGVLRRLREAIRQKRPELWRSKSWILHHDNTPAHTALKISKFLQDHLTSVFPQPPYSPDLAPCDFILFGKLKKKLKGWKFQSIEEIKVESKKAMKAIPKTDYQRCFADWKKKVVEPKTSFRVVQALLGGSGRDRRQRAFRSTSTTPEKVDKVLELVREDRRITVREVAEEAGISFGSTQSIMKDILGMRSLNAVLVPKELTFDQKNARKETASLNLEATTDDPELLKRVITGDEHGFTALIRKLPNRHRIKVMLTVFFDYQGIVHHGFQQQGSTITDDSYLGVLRRLREAIRQKRPELWRSKSWILHHDNAPEHTALKISKFLQDHSTSVFPQPPCDFFLFGKLKKKVKGSEISEHR
ncbi:hypothetical protein LAZ67_9002433 [Cordylochernes scorpioides]|uniref:Transposase n=1 Tax=Cordylochernes scorpioides TaxID=51811 RepID=A0ABY6KTV5_9ARAC|nr:hypothetical protein LAZ67_9002433 [Cordylochernes scorpioides]